MPAAVPEGPLALPFDCRWGEALLVWSPAGIHELYLPDPLASRRRRQAPARQPRTIADEAGARHRPPIVSRRRAGAIARAIADRIAGHLEGELDDFLDLELIYPEKATRFRLAVWEAARRVPPGLVLSYGELAEEVGRPGAARAVGTAMKETPFPLLVPAHRVIGAGRRPGGWTGPGGVSRKLALLEIEGVDLLG
ncbi:MAG: MGMT family protein [Deltaproteobacteria bacterium]|nr:MGMT family protein [Deltaproteobacteria bacterium]